MSRMTSKTALAGMAIGLCVVGAGCTVPHYSRKVIRSYDADGNLTGIVVEESVDQLDPNSKPVLKVLKNQTYDK